MRIVFDSDAVVKIAFKRRAYRGKQRKDEMYVRLVTIYKRVSETLMRIYISQGLDPHVNRKRFRAQWVE